MRQSAQALFLSARTWGLCHKICHHVTADFNPLREYMRNAELYPHDPAKAYANLWK